MIGTRSYIVHAGEALNLRHWLGVSSNSSGETKRRGARRSKLDRRGAGVAPSNDPLPGDGPERRLRDVSRLFSPDFSLTLEPARSRELAQRVRDAAIEAAPSRAVSDTLRR